MNGAGGGKIILDKQLGEKFHKGTIFELHFEKQVENRQAERKENYILVSTR